MVPFSIFYGTAIRMRNLFYDRGWRKSFAFDFPVISVGNLSTGGTGKTPHIEYLIRLLLDHGQTPTVLSRGYGRKTYGYRLASVSDDARTIGDEPAQIKRKFPNVAVAVSANRARVIPQLLADAPETDVILLDDALQHRVVKPGLSILLTSSQRPFWNDRLLPVGRLREPSSEQKRADMLVVTKCMGEGSSGESVVGGRGSVVSEREKEGTVFYTALRYGEPYHIAASPDLKSGLPNDVSAWSVLQIPTNVAAIAAIKGDVLLVCGIADPDPLVQHLESVARSVTVMRFRDHHYYSHSDIRRLRRAFDRINSSNKVIVTTEKDAVRLLLLDEDWTKWPLFVLPVGVHFVDGKERFDSRVLALVRESQGLNIAD